jgi:hypothetical protein
MEGVNMEKDGDSEEDNDEEVVKQVLNPPSSLSFSLYSFLPNIFLIPVSCAFQHLANLSFSHLR